MRWLRPTACTLGNCLVNMAADSASWGRTSFCGQHLTYFHQEASALPLFPHLPCVLLSRPSSSLLPRLCMSPGTSFCTQYSLSGSCPPQEGKSGPEVTEHSLNTPLRQLPVRFHKRDFTALANTLGDKHGYPLLEMTNRSSGGLGGPGTVRTQVAGPRWGGC